MISYYIIIIIIIVCTEVYFRLSNPVEQIENEIYTPWIKVKNYDNYTKYYIKINNIDKKKLEEWEGLNDINIKYNFTQKCLIIKCLTEEEALAIVNLFISNMCNEIEMNEIIENDMINVSYKKAKKYKMVKNKLIELIKENLSKLNSDVKDETFMNNYYDTDKDVIINNIVNDYSRLAVDSKTIIEEPDIPIKIDNCNAILNKVDENIIYEIKPQEKIVSSVIQAYEGSEYATLSF